MRKRTRFVASVFWKLFEVFVLYVSSTLCVHCPSRRASLSALVVFGQNPTVRISCVFLCVK